MKVKDLSAQLSGESFAFLWAVSSLGGRGQGASAVVAQGNIESRGTRHGDSGHRATTLVVVACTH